jgi:hypothetical protein
VVEKVEVTMSIKRSAERTSITNMAVKIEFAIKSRVSQ